jgi:hypothetical protein
MKAWLKQIFSPQPQEKAVEFLPESSARRLRAAYQLRFILFWPFLC